MEQIHNKLLESSEAYSKWHDHPHHKKFHWGVALVVAIFILLSLLKGVAYWKSTMYDDQTIKIAHRTATLTLDPQSKSVKVGGSFNVNVVLDTAGDLTDGVDIYQLHYDPALLSVVDADGSKDGVQISAGNLMPVTIVNKVDGKLGTIQLSQATSGGASYQGKGVLATINFKAVKAGNSYLKFDFKQGESKDTNVAYGGRDRLLSAVDALYTITE